MSLESQHDSNSSALQSTLRSTFNDCSVILLAVSDRAIESIAAEIRSVPGFEHRTLIHFSGALNTDLAWGFHPLMTFADAPYSLDKYEEIPFLIDEDAPAFGEVFPKLKNPSARMPREQKALYHAWCVMGGNFTSFLWTQMFEAFSSELGLDPALATPYLKQVSENLLKNPKTARNTWTGPIVRGDLKTIESHLKALEGNPYQAIYRAFLASQESSKERNAP
jgi:predicted short-subunit dehydrogenase-like oxidoreductase (DUF2520 family)